jgi:hypothetical protein
MKQRRPWLYYLLGFLSGGLFWIAWPFLMARDVNVASRGNVPRLRALTVAYCGVFTLYLGLVAYQMYRVETYTPSDGQPFQPISWSYIGLLAALALFLLACPAYLAAKTSAFLRGRGRSALGPFASAALFLCYGISLPLLQRKLNEEWVAQPNTTLNPDAAP